MEERARRVRNLLSSYYGTTPRKDADDGEVNGEATSPAKVTINTRGFDAEKHVGHMVCTLSRHRYHDSTFHTCRFLFTRLH